MKINLGDGIKIMKEIYKNMTEQIYKNTTEQIYKNTIEQIQIAEPYFFKKSGIVRNGKTI